jgi:hypothetical protein
MDLKQIPDRDPGDSDHLGRYEGTELPEKPGSFRKKAVLWWSRQSFGIKTAVFGGGLGALVFLAVFSARALRTPPSPSLNSLPVPGPMALRPRVPVRTIAPAPVDVEGIRAAGSPEVRTVSPSGGSSPGSSSAPLTSSPSPPFAPTPENLWHQMGAVTVEIAGLSEAVQRLEAEEMALLKGQEWIERTMSRESPSRSPRADTAPTGSSAPLADDRPAASSSPSGGSSPVLMGWRVIGVSGTGAVLVDPSGVDHLVRKGREVRGVAVTGIDPETGAVAFSDGEILRP